jgi:hypothetical protein
MPRLFDGQASWNGFGDGFGAWKSSCRLVVFREGDRSVVVASDEGAEGTSITNGAEHLAQKTVSQHGLDPAKMAWIEHYAHRTPGEEEETLDLVEFKWANGMASKPKWFRIGDRGFERELLAALKDQEGDLPESFMTRFYEAGFIKR